MPEEPINEIIAAALDDAGVDYRPSNSRKDFFLPAARLLIGTEEDSEGDYGIIVYGREGGEWLARMIRKGFVLPIPGRVIR